VVVEIVDQPRQIESEDVPRTLTPATVIDVFKGSLAVGDMIDIERYEELGQHMRIDGVNPVALIEGKRFLLFLSRGDASDTAFAFTDQAAAFEQLADGTFQRTYEVPTKLESVVDLDSLR
jgi:ABC-type phosphate transport system substrate-binding protein